MLNHHSFKNIATCSDKPKLKLSSLRSRADEVLIAVAVLGLVAAISDGEADLREIDSFTIELKKRFALSRRYSLKLVSAALGRIRHAGEINVIDSACDTLNEHLNTLQKIALFEGLADVLIADGKIHESEECFLDYIVHKLKLAESVKEYYQIL